MKKPAMLIPSAILMLTMPMVATVQADSSAASATTIGQATQQNLQGFWVDASGRGVLNIADGVATISATGEADPQNTYQLELTADNQLTLTLAQGSKTTNKTINTQVNWQQQTISFGLYKFVRPPQISETMLEGYWHEEADVQGAKHIRAIEYKENASRYDYYWWRVTPAMGTFQKGVDRDVALQITHGFIFSDPNSGSGYVHYAIQQDGDTIYYVDRNGATWSETKTDRLYSYDAPKGYKEMKDWMTAR